MSRMIRVGLVGAIAMAAAGCEYDSWLDPSVVGRWEDTPAVAPILDRIDVVETPEEDFVATSEIVAEDLIPQRISYKVGAGDLLNIEVFELLAQDTTYQTQRVVDQTGSIGMPLLGRIRAAGLTEIELQSAIADRAIERGLFTADDPPEVSVVAETKRANTFTVFGLVRTPARYPIPDPEFKLLDALATAGASIEQLNKVYVIRQAPLDEALITGFGEPGRDDERDDELRPLEPIRPRDNRTVPPGDDEGLEELIDELLQMEDEPQGGGADDPDQPTNPGAISARRQPADQSGAESPEPVLDIPAPFGREADDNARWIYLNGSWVRVASRSMPEMEIEESEVLADRTDLSSLVTQRVIEISAEPLRKGDARYNIVVRPNDVIRIPAPESGVFYVEGQVARPGSYDLPFSGRMTLRRAITSAGGLGPLAIPERVEITRTISGDRQVTVLFNLRAIYESTAPDVYIKPQDQINVGTTWYAAPLAVIRNGFRTTYGFGFLLDRNFGNDVFGAPPTSRTTR